MPEPTKWQTYVGERLASIAALEAGWDSYSSRPIAPVAIDRARKFLDVIEVVRLAFPGVDCPSICPTSDGGVDLEWHPVGGAWVSIEFTPDGRVEAVGRDREWTVELSRGYVDAPDHREPGNA